MIADLNLASLASPPAAWIALLTIARASSPDSAAPAKMNRNETVTKIATNLRMMNLQKQGIVTPLAAWRSRGVLRPPSRKWQTRLFCQIAFQRQRRVNAVFAESQVGTDRRELLEHLAERRTRVDTGRQFRLPHRTVTQVDDLVLLPIVAE